MANIGTFSKTTTGFSGISSSQPHDSIATMPNRFWHDLTPAQQAQARVMFHPIGGDYCSYTYEIGRTGHVLSRKRLSSL